MNGELKYEVQKAFFDRLSQDAGLAALVGTDASGLVKVYDFVDQRVTVPYVTIGNMTGIDSGDKDRPGQEITITINFYTVEKGNKQLSLVSKRIVDLFHERKLTLAVGEAFNVRRDNSLTRNGDDGATRMGQERFRLTAVDTDATNNSY